MGLREWWGKHGLLTRSQAHEIAHRAGEQAVLEERRWLGYGQGDRPSNTDDPVTFAEAWQWAEGSKLAKTLKLTEAADFSALADRSSWIMMGLSSAEDADRVLSDGKLRNLQDAAFEKAQNNPHAKGAVKAIRKYVAGRGVAVSSPVKEVNEVIQDFWRDNNLNERHKAMVRSVYIEGEYFCLYSISPATGHVTMRRIPPKEITGIETDPEDIENVFTYQRQFVVATGVKEERYYADIDYFRNLKKAEAEGVEPLPKSSVHDGIRKQAIEGDVLVQFIRWGEEGEKRGRVPMSAELPYFKMMEQINQDAARRCHEQAKVIWFKKITGRTSEATTRERRAPAGGVMLVETDSVSYRAESPKLAAGDMETVRGMLLHTIGAGLQIPDVILDSNADTQTYACHDAETQALTLDGWKYYEDLTDQDMIATVDMESDQLVYQRPTAIHVYDYKGEMVTVQGRQVDLCVTPNHRVIVSPQSSKHGPVWSFADASELWTYCYLKAATRWNGGVTQDTFVLPGRPHRRADMCRPARDIPMNDWLQFLGFWLSEGCILHADREAPRQFRISIVQKKPDIAAKIKSLMERLPFKCHCGQWPKNEAYEWAIDDSALWTWLKEHAIGKQHVRRVPKFFRELPEAQLRILFDAMMDGDGTRRKEGGMSYATTSPGMADDVQEIAIRLGYKARVMTSIDTRPENRRPLHTVSMTRSSVGFYQVRKPQIQRMDYDGPVWCVSVPNGVFITRRNGRIGIHGNSIKKSDTPFLQEVLDWQDFWDDHLRVMLSVPIRAAIEAKRLPPTITINRFVEEAVWDVVDRVIEGVMSHVPMSVILSDVRPLLEGKEETVTVPTEEAPISIVFPVLISESPLEQAHALQVWQALGVSNQTLITKLGLDWKEELANRKAMMEMEAQAAEEQMAKFAQGKTPEPPGKVPSEE